MARAVGFTDCDAELVARDWKKCASLGELGYSYSNSETHLLLNRVERFTARRSLWRVSVPSVEHQSPPRCNSARRAARLSLRQPPVHLHPPQWLMLCPW